MVEQIQGYRLSPQQRGVWEADKRNGNKSYTFMEISINAEAKSTEEVKEAIYGWINQNELFSIQFREMSGLKYPVQYVSEDALSIQYKDWSTADENEKQSKIIRIKQKYHQLDQGEESTFVLIRLSQSEYRLLLWVSRLLLDQRIKPLLCNLSDYLQGSNQGNDEISYIAVADWLNNIVDSEEAAAGHEYWNHQFQQKKDDLYLPKDKSEHTLSRLSNLNIEVDKREINLGSDHLTEETFLAAWLILLEKLYGEQPFIGLGMVSEEEELEELIGCLMNYVPLSISFDPNQSVRQFIGILTQKINNHKEWFEVFDERYLTGTNEQVSYSYGFEYQQASKLVNYEGISISLISQLDSSKYFPLRLVVLEDDNIWKIKLVFESSLYDSRMMEELLERFRLLLKRIAEDINQPIWKISPLLDNEGISNLRKPIENRTPLFKTVLEGFRHQAKINPSKTAIVYQDQTLSYSELDQWSNQIGKKMVEIVGEALEGRAIGIYMDRSAEAVAAILAIHKLGAFYVPIDPSWPIDRIEYIRQHNHLVTTMADEKTSKNLKDNTFIIPDLVRDKTESMTVTGDFQNLVAYTIYTSGSTGIPKGVMVENHQLMEYVESFRKEVAFADSDQLAYLNPITADIGNTILYTSLCYGLTLHILSDEVGYNPDKFASYIKDHSIAGYKITPSQFRYLNQEGVEINELVPQKHLIFGGEVLSRQVIDHINKDSLNIHNHYGPTETTIGATICQLSGLYRGTEISIGSPFEHVELLILDSYMQEVPEGVYGELYIGGSGLGRGYFGRPELTAAAYVPHPLKIGQRMYKTGDVVKRIGNRYFFRSRKDQQVKINGYRIELDEITSTVEKLDQVFQAAAVLKEDEFNNQNICLYIVPNGVLDLTQIKNHLKQQLPEYMLPLYYLQLGKLPLTTSGKLDIKALPMPEKKEELKEFQEPETEIQCRIADIWKNVLGKEEISIYSNFFAIGGHSLLATKVIVELREGFGVELPLRQLFESPTIKDLEETIEKLLFEEINSLSEKELELLLESYEGD
jgi:amino acid adenylation domain-containing protein